MQYIGYRENCLTSSKFGSHKMNNKVEVAPPFEQTLITPSAGGFREEVENVKICFLSHNFITNVAGATDI